MVTVTVRAAAKAKELATEERMPSCTLRLKVIGGGCAGFQYDMYFEDRVAADLDEVFEDKGVTVLVDPLSLQYIDGTELDYVTSDTEEGFKFLNPQAKGSCGCGSSFSA